MSPLTPHLIALDIDGTLVSYAGQMTAQTRSAVQATAAAGHHVVLSTGRSLSGVLEPHRTVRLGDSYVVSSNGSQISHLDQDTVIKVLHQETFVPDEVLKTMADQLPDFGLSVELPTGGFVVYDPEKTGELSKLLSVDCAAGATVHCPQLPGLGTITEVDSLAELMGQPVLRVAGQGEGQDLDRLHRVAQGLGLPGASFGFGHVCWMDIGPDGVSKASALAILRQELATPQECTIAVGDGNNDIDMLSWAQQAFAMAEANSAVRAVADHVVPGPQHHGVAVALQLAGVCPE